MPHVRGDFRRSLLLAAGLMVLIGPLFLSLGERRSSVQAAGCWKAEITEQWTDLGLAGSVLRVAVHGKPGLPVTVRSLGDFQTSNFTGTKPEYGPNVAEFAPLSLGTYLIEPQGLGVVFEIWLDGRNYTRVDFTPLPCASAATLTPQPATATARAQATATPRILATATATSRPVATVTPLPPPPVSPVQPVSGWHGRVAERLENPGGVYFATIAVRVIGRPAGQTVEIRSNGWSAIEKTGTKPEHGPDACEFGALNPGTYRLTPTDLGTNLDVTVAHGDFVLVEFYQTGGAGSATCWVASVVENTSGDQPTLFVDSAIAVVVSGKPWYDVEIRSDGWSTTTQTGYKQEYGPDACEFGGLRAATYTLIPKDLGVSIQVTMDGRGWAMVRFDQVAAPAPRPAQPTQPSQPTQTPAPGPTAWPQPSPTAAAAGWKGWVVSNSSGESDRAGVSSVIVVRVLNWPGVPVSITGGGGWSATCITGTKPEYGPDACEFGGLWPSTYTLRPEGADVQVEVTMDGRGVAFVDFAAR